MDLQDDDQWLQSPGGGLQTPQTPQAPPGPPAATQTGLIGSSSSRPYKEFADKPGFWASPAPLHPLQDMWAPQAVPRPYGGPTEHSDSTKRGNLAYGRLTQSEPTCPLEGQVGSGSGGEVPSRGA